MAEHDQNLVEAAVAKAIEQYQAQRGRGSVPGGLTRAAAELLHPKVDSARELLAKVKYAVGCTSGFGDFTYRKPNRRQPQGGALLPAHVKPIPRVTVIVDTSGSMEESDLALALGVIGNALRSLPDPRGLRVLAGDTAVACARMSFGPSRSNSAVAAARIGAPPPPLLRRHHRPLLRCHHSVPAHTIAAKSCSLHQLYGCRCGCPSTSRHKGRAGASGSCAPSRRKRP